MKLFKLFSGKTPEAHEEEADALFEAGAFGPAKIEYEKALDKLEKKGEGDADTARLLQQKRSRSMEALAFNHLQHAGELIETRHLEEAEELLHLALELSPDHAVVREANAKLAEIGRQQLSEEAQLPEKTDLHVEDGWPDQEAPAPQGSDEEVLNALFESLSEEEQSAYRTYGDAFEKGYMALNQGDFEAAAAALSQALEDNGPSETLIPLELATAHMNLGDTGAARSLLMDFLSRHPESLKAYHLLCDIYWENREFDDAWQLLLSCPPEIARSLHIFLLRGETLFLAGKYDDAETLYLDYLNTSGWDEHIAQSLGKTYEALGLPEKARELYEEIISACRGCGARVDAQVKQRYADTSLETGSHSTKILEIYFDLIQEDPDNRPAYYHKISRIYTLQGNQREARRYQSMAEAHD